MLETLVGVGVLVALMLIAMEIFKKNSSTTAPKSGGSGPIDEGTGTGDGSVTPPRGPEAQ